MSSLVATNVRQAGTLPLRLRGLMGQTREQAGAGLLLRPCRSIHTAFMRFPIDVVFLDRDGRVLKIAVCVRPWRVVLAPWRTAAVLELPHGYDRIKDVSAGCRLEMTGHSVWLREASSG